MRKRPMSQGPFIYLQAYRFNLDIDILRTTVFFYLSSSSCNYILRKPAWVTRYFTTTVGRTLQVFFSLTHIRNKSALKRIDIAGHIGTHFSIRAERWAIASLAVLGS